MRNKCFTDAVAGRRAVRQLSRILSFYVLVRKDAKRDETLNSYPVNGLRVEGAQRDLGIDGDAELPQLEKRQVAVGVAR